MIVEPGTWAQADVDPPFTPETYGCYLRLLRKRRGLTMRDLSRESGVAQSYISMMESGSRYHTGASKTPSLKILLRLAEYFGVSVDTLLTLGGFKEPDPDPSCPPPTVGSVFHDQLAQGIMSTEEESCISTRVKQLWIESILLFDRLSPEEQQATASVLLGVAPWVPSAERSSLSSRRRGSAAEKSP